MDSPFSVRSLTLLVLLHAPENGANGAQIVKAVALLSKGNIVLNPGSIYPVIKTLLAEDLLQIIKGVSTTVRPGRPTTNYSLTYAGQAEARRIKAVMEELIRDAATENDVSDWVLALREVQ